MSEIRPFARSDRDQLTRLANAHIATVMPGWSIPVSTLLAQLERQPGEYITFLYMASSPSFFAISGTKSSRGTARKGRRTDSVLMAHLCSRCSTSFRRSAVEVVVNSPPASPPVVSRARANARKTR